MINIAQISDCHLFADANKSSYANINPYQSLARILSDIAQQHFDLLIVSGDLSADGSAASYQHFLTLVAKYKISCQYVILPGNHDDLGVLEQNFCESSLWFHYPPDSPLSLDNWQLHFLNTKTAGTGGYLAEDDITHLARAIEHNQQSFQLLAAHHHPVPTDSWMDAHGWSNGQRLLDVVAGFHSVKALIHGHIHSASEKKIGFLDCFSCPSTCWQWAMQPEFGVGDLAPGYRLLILMPTGEIDTDIIRVG